MHARQERRRFESEYASWEKAEAEHQRKFRPRMAEAMQAQPRSAAANFHCETMRELRLAEPLTDPTVHCAIVRDRWSRLKSNVLKKAGKAAERRRREYHDANADLPHFNTQVRCRFTTLSNLLRKE